LHSAQLEIGLSDCISSAGYIMIGWWVTADRKFANCKADLASYARGSVHLVEYGV